MKLKTKVLAWDASPDTDVTDYVIYCVKEGETLSYDSPNVSVPASQLEYVLPGAFNMSAPGNYTLAVAAYSNGDEADQVAVTSFFDFSGVSPVANVRIITR